MWWESVEQGADAPLRGFLGALGSLAQQVFELCEDLLDRVEVGAVGRQEQEARAFSPDCLTAGFLWLERLSKVTISPGSSVGQSCSSTHCVKVEPLIGWAPKGQRLHAKVLWPLADYDVHCHPALRPDRCPVCARSADKRRKFCRMGRAVLDPDTGIGRHRDHGHLSSHKRPAIRQAIRAAKAKLLYLPPYSPDLHPIEQMFFKLKHLLRKASERTAEATWRKIGTLLDAFPPHECANYFVNSGYASV